MILLKIEDKQYQLASEWTDLTIQSAIDYYAIPQPEVLKEVNKALMRDKAVEISQRDRMITIPQYYGRVIQLWSDIPGEVIDRLFWKPRTEIFETYLYKFMLGLDFSPAYHPEGIKDFTHQGQVYVIPDADRMTAVEWCEAADMEATGAELFGSRGESMARMMAILCRPEGERYNEETIKTRIELFKSLPMNIVWEVYDFFLRYSSGLSSSAAEYLKREVSKPGWLLPKLDTVDSVGMVQ